VLDNIPEDLKFSSVAVGFAHVVAATDTQVYCWGLNCFGQLGTDNESIKSLAVPTLVYTAEDDSIAEVYALFHSSAIRLSSGRLLTWGDGRHHRLLQHDTRTIHKPTLVSRLADEKVCRFLFTPTGAAFCSESLVKNVRILSNNNNSKIYSIFDQEFVSILIDLDISWYYSG